MNPFTESIFERAALATLRDTLLPKPISDELRVPHTETFFARAGA